MASRSHRIALTALFVTCLMAAQVLASKLAVLSLPVIGALVFPAGTVAYAGTFFASDVMAELHGREDAHRMVNAGFAMNFVLLGLVYLAIAWPAAKGSIDPGQFAAVLGASTNIIAGSLFAYIVSQHWDVLVFHRLRKLMDGRRLWVRNLTSTGTSQLIDTVLFTAVAFWVAPTAFGIGVALPVGVLVSIVVGQYIVKAVIAAIDTPLVYAAVKVA